MERKELIKSRVNVNKEIMQDFSVCLNNYLKGKIQETQPPFDDGKRRKDGSQSQIHRNFKKSLSDFRCMYSQREFKKTPQCYTGRLSKFLNKQNNQNQMRPTTVQLYTKTTYSSKTFRRQHTQTPENSCRKVHSSFSHTVKVKPSQQSPFKPQLTPFIIVQNMYESKVNDVLLEKNQGNKRVQTARIKQYYERKAEKVEELQNVFDQLSMRISQGSVTNEEETGNITKEFIKTRNGFLSRRKRADRKDLLPDQRKNHRIVMPNQFFKNFNKVKIPQKYVLKDYLLK